MSRNFLAATHCFTSMLTADAAELFRGSGDLKGCFPTVAPRNGHKYKRPKDMFCIFVFFAIFGPSA